MKTIQIPRTNWHSALANAVESADDGDTIECHTREMALLGWSAKFRMCPNKSLIFVAPDGVVTINDFEEEKARE